MRLDDKLNRIIKGDFDGEDEDVLLDLVGYWVLREVIKKGQE